MSNVWTCDVNVFIVDNVDKLSVLIPRNYSTIRGHAHVTKVIPQNMDTDSVIKTLTKKKRFCTYLSLFCLIRQIVDWIKANTYVFDTIARHNQEL